MMKDGAERPGPDSGRPQARGDDGAAPDGQGADGEKRMPERTSRQGGGKGSGGGKGRGGGAGQGGGGGAGQGGGGGAGQGGGGKRGGPKQRAQRQMARRKAREENLPAKPSGASIIVDVQSEEIARRARRRQVRSRIALWTSFALMVAAPTAISAWYLNVVAADQYASQVGFAVRSLDSALPSPMTELLGGAADSTVGDSEMLYEYLQSAPLVRRVDEALDLETLYNRPEADPLFRMGEDQTLEEMVGYWNRAVSVSYDSGTGVVFVEVRAFRPRDAQQVASEVLQESGRLINDLSEEARQDAVRFARVDVKEAEQRVRRARMALQAFRSTQGTADVSGDISQEMQLIAQLRSQRSALQADYDSRKDLLGADSPTLSALRRRIESLDAQIAEAEARIADGGTGEAAASGSPTQGKAATLAEAAGLQEELQVELELATNMYTAAQSSLEAARADARRAQRYLATHIRPTLAEEPEYPQRIMWSFAIFGVLLICWSILMLIISSVRDRN